MKIAHLILAHKNPKQVELLLNALEHPGFYFYLHIDAKTDEVPFHYLAKRDKVFFIKKRASIYWAAYGTIQATINGFEEIIPLSYDYINVISGQDFPLKSADYIYNFFQKNYPTEYITCHSIDNEWPVAPRVRKYHLINWKIPGKYRLERFVNFILPERKFPFDYKIVGRANWFALTNNAAKYIIDFIHKHPEIVSYFKYCWGADEFMFSTILYNSIFHDKITENFIYVDWSSGKAHPKILAVEDYNAMISSTKLFARKFDMQTDSLILKMLAESIGVKDKLIA